MKELTLGATYKTRDGHVVKIRLSKFRTDPHEKRQSGADILVQSDLGWYWFDGPMAGYYLDDRNLDNYKARPHSRDILIPSEYKHVQLNLL